MTTDILKNVQAGSATTSRTWSFWLAAVLVVAVAILAYWPGLSGPFVFDDYPNIVTNKRVHADHIDLETIARAAKGYEPGQIGRPLATLSFAANYYFSGANPWSYKITGVVFHGLNALLVLALLTTIARLPRLNGRYGLAFCLAISLLWAAHPLQVSTVLYVVQRMEILSLTFVLVGLLLYLLGRRRQINGQAGGWLIVLSAFVAMLGLGAKETAALFPLYTLALELTVLGFAARSERVEKFYRWGYLAAVVLALLTFLIFVLPPRLTENAFAGRPFTLYERLLTQFRVLAMYLGQILLPLPSHLLFYYDAYPKSTGLFSPWTTAASALLLLGLLGLGVGLRNRMPLFALGILWFFSGHFLTSNVLNLELAFEHRNYFAILGVLLAVGDLVSRIHLRDGPTLKYIAVGAVVVASLTLTLIRSATWGNDLLLYNELVDINPNSPRAGNDLAALLVAMANGDPDSPFYSLGKQQFERVALLPNASPLAEQGLILMAAVHHQPVEQAWWDNMVLKLNRRPLGPEEVLAVGGLLQQRYQGLPLDDQQLGRAYEAMLARNPKQAYLYAQFGDYALKYLHNENLADRAFLRAIEHSQGDPEYANILLEGLVTDGRTRQVDEVLKRGRELGLFGQSLTSEVK